MAKAQISSDQQALFCIQTQLNGVFQQLERLERVVGMPARANPVKVNDVGERNHKTENDNLEALTTRLFGLNKTLEFYNGLFDDACVAQLVRWYDGRKSPYPSVLTKAVSDTLDACTRRYRHTPTPVRLSEASLQMHCAKLAEAVQDFHKQEDRFQKDPAAFERKQAYPITRYQSVDKEAFQARLQSPPQKMPPVPDRRLTVPQSAPVERHKPERSCDNCFLL